MSLDEFDKHAKMGPLAGPATSPAATAGQQMYELGQRPTGGAPVTGYASAGAPPEWLTRNPLRRGLILFIVSNVGLALVTAYTNPRHELSVALGWIFTLGGFIGFVLLICGLIGLVTGRSARK